MLSVCGLRQGKLSYLKISIHSVMSSFYCFCLLLSLCPESVCLFILSEYSTERTFRQEGEQAYSIPQACLGDKHCGACLESSNLDLELGLLPRTLSAFTLPLEDLCQRCQYLPSEGICGRWRFSDCTLLPWSSEYKVMRCCSNMHLEPPPSW